MSIKKIVAAIAALTVSVSVSACPLEECMPQGASQKPSWRAEEARAWLMQFHDLKNPAQAVLHLSLAAVSHRAAVLDAENRALRRALETGTEPDFSSARMLPSTHSLESAIASDLRQIFVTGRAPQLEHIDRRISESYAAWATEEASKNAATE